MSEGKKFNSFQECLTEIENRYNSMEKIRKKLVGLSDTLEIKFLDTGKIVSIKINEDKGIEVKDNTPTPDAPVKIEFSAEDVLIKLYNKELGAVKAYSSGQIKVIEGNIKNLLKLKSLLF